MNSLPFKLCDATTWFENDQENSLQGALVYLIICLKGKKNEKKNEEEEEVE